MEAKKAPKQDLVLGVDIGGTNTTFAIASVTKGMVKLVYKRRYSSGEIGSIVEPTAEALRHAREEYGANITAACYAASGPVSADRTRCQPTWTKWGVDAKAIRKKTGIKDVFLVNDFTAAAYGVLQMPKGKIRLVKSGIPAKNGNIAVVGAGTGFGKNALVSSCDGYATVESEGGHADFPAQNAYDLDLIESIRRSGGLKQVTVEDVVSGRGIEGIYRHIRAQNPGKKSKYTVSIDAAKDKAALISKHRKSDWACRRTMEAFTGYYGRCVKDYALDVLATGGVYVCGGIAGKNPEIPGSKWFLNEFLKSDRKRALLGDMPVYAVSDYDVSLYGACYIAWVNSICR